MTKCGLGDIDRATGSFLSCHLRLLTGCQELLPSRDVPEWHPELTNITFLLWRVGISCRSRTSNEVKFQDWAKRMLYLTPMCCFSQYKNGERCCLVENSVRYKKHAWHLWDELVLNHLSTGITPSKGNSCLISHEAHWPCTLRAASSKHSAGTDRGGAEVMLQLLEVILIPAHPTGWKQTLH